MKKVYAILKVHKNENDINYLYGLSDKEYSTLFKNSAMKRTKLKGLKRNIDFVR